jgi:hypothetical protein
MLARGVCSHDGLALLLPALTHELSHLAGQRVVFLPGASSFSLPPGFVAPLGAWLHRIASSLLAILAWDRASVSRTRSCRSATARACARAKLSSPAAVEKTLD